MPDHRDLNPDRLKPGLVKGGRLKPGLVTPAYTGGTPGAAGQIKPSLRDRNGNLKPGLVQGNVLKPSLRNLNSAIWTPDSIDDANLLQNLGEQLIYAESLVGGLPVLASSIGTLAPARGQRCVNFDGSNDFADGGTSILNALGGANTSAFTVCMWIYPTSASNNGIINFGGFAGNQGSFSILLAGNLYVRTNGTTRIDQGGFTLNTWMHIAVAYSNSTLRLFFNGVQVATAAVEASLDLTGNKLILGSYFNSSFAFPGKMYDARLYDREKASAEVMAITNQHLAPDAIDRVGLVAGWWLQDEDGTTLRDWSGNGRHLTATNVQTPTPFHATDAGVKFSAANELGYTLSGSVVVPRNEATPTQDVAGGALQCAGPIALSGVMEVPCWTGNGTNANVNCGAAYVPASVNFTLGFWYRPTGTLSDKGPLTQGNNTSAASRFGLYHVAEDSLTLLVDHISGVGSGSVTRPIAKDVWSYVEIARSETTYTLTIAGSSASITNSGTINQGNLIIGLYGGFVSGSIAGLSITTGGVTRYPLFDQCGPGSSNTNRDFYIMGSDGSATLVSGGIVNGAISAIYANRCLFVHDWAIQHGGRIAANGAFIPGRIGSNLDAAGNAKTLLPGQHRNPFSRLIRNPFGAPSLAINGATPTTRLAPGDNDQATAPANTKFTSGFDRYFATRVPLTGDDLANAEEYRS
jgi:hypothetical protein